MADPPLPTSNSIPNSNSNSNNSPNSNNLSSRWSIPKATDPTKSFQFGRIIGGVVGAKGKEVRENEEEVDLRNDNTSSVRRSGDSREYVIDSRSSDGAQLMHKERTEVIQKPGRSGVDYNSGEESNISREDKIALVSQSNARDNTSGGNSFLSSLRISSNSLTGGIGSRISNANNRDIFSSPATLNRSRVDPFISGKPWQPPTPSTPNSIPSEIVSTRQIPLSASTNPSLRPSSNDFDTPLRPDNMAVEDNSNLRRSNRSQLASSPPLQHSPHAQQDQNQASLNLIRKRAAPISDAQPNSLNRLSPPTSRNNSNQSGGSNNIRVGRNSRGLSRERDHRDVTPGPSNFKRAKFDIEGTIGSVIGSLTDAQSQLDFKDERIARMEVELRDCKSELAKEVAAKEKIRRLSIGKLKSALSDFDKVKDELQSSSTGMKSAFQNISTELGGVVSVADVKVEIADMKEAFASRTLEEPSIEKLESSKLELLREVQGEVDKRQSVIELLRKELATRMGEITEARDRISTLELQSDKRIDKLDSLVSKLEAKEETLEEMEEIMLKKGREARESSDRALLLAGELELEKANLIRVQGNIEVLQESLSDKVKALEVANTDLKEFKESQSTTLLRLQSLTSTNSNLSTSMDALRSEYDEFKLRSNEEVERSKELMITFNEGLSALSRGYEKTFDGLSEKLEKAENKVSEFDQIKLDLSIASTSINLYKADAERIEALKRYNTDQLKTAQEEIKQIKLENSDLQKKYSATIAESSKKVEDGLKKEKELVREISNIQLELRNAKEEILNYRSNQSRLERDSTIGTTEEIQKLRQQLEKVRNTNDDLANEVSELKPKIGTLVSEKSVLSESTTTLETQLEERAAQIDVLNLEIQSLQERLLSKESHLAEVESKQAAAIQAASAQTYKNCEEESKRALALKANELKRLNNKFDDLTKKHQRALTELAKAKNRPIIDPHMASSSPVETQIVQQQQVRAGPSRVTFAEVLESPTESTTVTKPRHVLAEKSVTLSSLSEEQSESSSPDEIIDYTMNNIEIIAEVEKVIVVPPPPVVPKIPIVEDTGKSRRTRSKATHGNTRAGSVLSVEEDIEDDSQDTNLVRPKARAPPKTTYAKKKK